MLVILDEGPKEDLKRPQGEKQQLRYDPGTPGLMK